ncbi:MAG: ABC transporter transmembrane domain-containing protein [Gammaproteobacteria bacterium]|nr:ABC transporter transmembrane domain-containing protein [Gammaproteobacteria bacterium]
MSILRSFVSAYPVQSIILVIALLMSGVANSIGLSALLPVLNIAFKADPSERSGFEQSVLDFLTGTGLEPSLGVLLGVIVFAILLKSAMVMFAEVRIGYIAADVATGLRMRLLRAVLRSRWGYFAGQSPGSMANAMSTEAYRASLAYVMGVRVIALLIESVVYAFFALAVSWQATLLALLASAVILLISRRLVEMGRDGGVRQTRWYRQLLSTLTDTLQSVKSFKAMGREHLADEVLSEETDQLRGALKREALATAALAIGPGAHVRRWSSPSASGWHWPSSTWRWPRSPSWCWSWRTCSSRWARCRSSTSDCSPTSPPTGRCSGPSRTPRPRWSRSRGARVPELERDIVLENVDFSYGEHDILRDVDLNIRAGNSPVWWANRAAARPRSPT